MMDKRNLKILYMGSPSMSQKLLSKLVDDGFNIVAIVSNEDKITGRKKVLTPTPVKAYGLEKGIEVFTPRSIKKEHDFLSSIDFDLILTFAYGQIVPIEVLNAPRLGCLNLHGSLLPKLRGAAPIQRAIINGDKLTGVTLMEMVLKMDAGRMYAKKEVVIEENDNYTSLSDKIVDAAFNCFKDNIEAYVEGSLKGEEQKEEEVSFANKILPEEERLSLELGYFDFINKVRGLSLTPGAYLYLEDKKLKIFSCHLENKETNLEIGSLSKVGKKLLLQLKDGVVSIDSLQLEGKKMMDAVSFLNGFHINEGSKLS